MRSVVGDARRSGAAVTMVTREPGARPILITSTGYGSDRFSLGLEGVDIPLVHHKASGWVSVETITRDMINKRLPALETTTVGGEEIPLVLGDLLWAITVLELLLWSGGR